MDKQKPAQSFRYGNVEAAIWENETEKGTLYNVTLTRHFKDADEWKKTDSFRRDDLLVVAKLADKAHTWIFEHS